MADDSNFSTRSGVSREIHVDDDPLSHVVRLDDAEEDLIDHEAEAISDHISPTRGLFGADGKFVDPKGWFSKRIKFGTYPAYAYFNCPFTVWPEKQSDELVSEFKTVLTKLQFPFVIYQIFRV